LSAPSLDPNFGEIPKNVTLAAKGGDDSPRAPPTLFAARAQRASQAPRQNVSVPNPGRSNSLRPRPKLGRRAACRIGLAQAGLP